jgi:hypothetical protein
MVMLNEMENSGLEIRPMIKILKMSRMKYFNKKVGLHTFIGGVSQPDNKEITQLVGLHIRWRALKST